MVFIMSLHEFDSVRLLLAKGDFDSPKSLWPKYRILDAARICGMGLHPVALELSGVGTMELLHLCD
jgi:hypothetical protein